MDRPTLFSTPMVRRLPGIEKDPEKWKTQTRRIVTVPWKGSRRALPYEPYYVDEDGKLLFADQYGDYHPIEKLDSAYARVGDRLWVRETWAPTHGSLSHEYNEHSVFEWREEMHGPLAKDALGLELYYRADGEDALPAEFSMPHGSEIRWRPSIFMPRWASRITLDVTAVRVERLHDISEEDARAEGAEPIGITFQNDAAGSPRFVESLGGPYRDGFRILWAEINGADSWTANPWVWVVSFKRAANEFAGRAA